MLPFALDQIFVQDFIFEVIILATFDQILKLYTLPLPFPLEGQVSLGEAIIKVNLVPSIPEIDPVFCNIFHGLRKFLSGAFRKGYSVRNA